MEKNVSYIPPVLLWLLCLNSQWFTLGGGVFVVVYTTSSASFHKPSSPLFAPLLSQPEPARSLLLAAQLNELMAAHLPAVSNYAT